MPKRNRLTLQFVNDSFQEILRRLDVMDSFGEKTQAFQERIEGFQERTEAFQREMESLGIKAFQERTETFHAETRANFARLQDTVNSMSIFVARIPEIESRLAALDSRMRALEARISNLEGLYLRHDTRLEILDHEYVAITAALKRLEERFDKLEADKLRDRVRVLEEKVAALEKNTLN
jgi:chromosome segregation ATPase